MENVICTLSHIFKVFSVGTRRRRKLEYRCEKCGTIRSF
jgi:hypothetical protein